MIKFIHTADLQVGMPFHWAGERARQQLREVREEAVTRIAKVAREEAVDFMLIAGDFFDANTVGDDVVGRVCERLEAFDVPVLILPGNHDYAGGPGSVYRRDGDNDGAACESLSQATSAWMLSLRAAPRW